MKKLKQTKANLDKHKGPWMIWHRDRPKNYIINSKGKQMSWAYGEKIESPYEGVVWGLALAITAPTDELAKSVLHEMPHVDDFTEVEYEDARYDALKLADIYTIQHEGAKQ